jgi:hypothetical protein
MTYETTEAYRGDPRRALDFLAGILTAYGYRIEELTDSTLRAAAATMFSNGRRYPLLGAANIEFTASGGLLRARADVTGGKKLFLAMGLGMLFPMAFLEWIFLAGRLHDQPAGQWVAVVPALVVCPWLVLLPLIYRYSQGRARRGIQLLLHNAAMATR